MNCYRVDYSDIERAVGRVLYLHDGVDIGSGAFDIDCSASFRILLPRYVGVVSVYAEIYNESISEVLTVFSGKLIPNESSTDAFEIALETDKLKKGLYFVRFMFDTVAGRIYGYRFGEELRLTCSPSIPQHFQMSVYSFSSNVPSKYLGGTIYHIFVDRFFKSGNVEIRKDAVMMNDWDNGTPEYPEYPGAHLENNTFFGGTLFGVVDKLDYIKSLGVNLIYLSPIFEAYSNHKYDTGDYMKVDGMFGGDEALRLLITEAEKRGIGIILDGVFNHTGADSRYFNKYSKYETLGAYQSPDSPYYKWYDFQSFPDKYTSWWGIEILPRINPNIDECGNFIAGEGGVIDKYSKMGIAGFRLDVADELSDEFLAKIKSRLSKNIDQSLLYGEVWEDASNKIAYNQRKKYYLGDELDAVMNYPYRVGIISYLRNKDTEKLRYALTDVTFNAPKRVRDLQMNLLGTHDTERIITILAGASAEGKTNAELSVTFLSKKEKARGVKLVKAAYTILTTLPGIPAIFYGDEVGLQGYKDPFNRRPYPWNKADDEIRNHYIRLGEIRNSYAVYADGDFHLEIIDKEILVFSRCKENRKLITVVNNSEKAKAIEFSSVTTELVSKTRRKTHELSALGAYVFDVSKTDSYEII